MKSKPPQESTKSQELVRNRSPNQKRTPPASKARRRSGVANPQPHENTDWHDEALFFLLLTAMNNKPVFRGVKYALNQHLQPRFSFVSAISSRDSLQHYSPSASFPLLLRTSTFGYSFPFCSLSLITHLTVRITVLSVCLGK